MFFGLILNAFARHQLKAYELAYYECDSYQRFQLQLINDHSSIDTKWDLIIVSIEISIVVKQARMFGFWTDHRILVKFNSLTL